MRVNRSVISILLIITLATVSAGVRPVSGVGMFSISANPTMINNIQPGMHAVSNITVTNTDTSTDVVAITDPSSSSLSCALNATSLTISPGASGHVSVNCQAGVLGTFNVNVTGSTGTVTNFAEVVFVFKDLANLDATSTSQTDVIVIPSATQPKSFRIGAIVNASATTSVANIYGWQFTINYNATAFIPQGDPDPAASYPDGAANAVLFGAQTTAGTANWAGLASSGKAFGSSTNTVAGSSGQLTVFFAILAPNPAVTISAKTLFANANFELLNKPTTPQLFTITNVLVVDSTGTGLPISTGSGVTERISNTPPTAKITVTGLAKGDPSCVPVTGSNCTAYAFKFDASTSTANGTIANPAGYLWDFADGTQDLGVTGPVVIHDYGMTGKFNITLRVVDSLGATGAARDALGNPTVNSQPSHTILNLIAATGFTIQATPSFFSIGPNQVGVVATSALKFTSINFGTGTISLSAASTHAGPNAPTWSFNPSSVLLPSGGSISSSISITYTSATPNLEYNITVAATLGTIINNITITLIPTTIRVVPAVVTGVLTGSQFTVTIADSAVNLFAWQFQLNYNQTLLSASISSVSFGSYWTAQAAVNKAFLIRQVNQTGGNILMAATLLDKTVAFTGNGTLATIKFTVKTTGDTTLGLTNDFLINAVGLGQSLPFIQSNGVFCNIPCNNHNVVVYSLSVPAKVTVGGSAILNATITNLGLSAENVTVTFKAGTINIVSQQVYLNPGNTTTIRVLWSTTNVATGTYTVTVQTTTADMSGQTTSTSSASGSVNVASATSPPPPPTTFPIIYIAIGAVAAAAAVAAFLLIRRRRTRPIGAQA